LALANHESAKREFPPGRPGCDATNVAVECLPHLGGQPNDEKSGESFLVLLLPYLEEKALYDLLDVDGTGLWWSTASGVTGWRTPEKELAIGQRPNVYVCPSSTTKPFSERPNYDSWSVKPATCTYAGSSGHRGPILTGVTACKMKLHNSGFFLYKNAVSIKKVRDGLSKTFAVGEIVEGHTIESSNVWTHFRRYSDSTRVTESALNTAPGYPPINISGEVLNGAFGSDHPGGGQFVYGDGHVDFLFNEIDLETYRSLSKIDDRKVLEQDADRDWCRNGRP
jgi:prepilin-type processing-associated H-X9-DG protein